MKFNELTTEKARFICKAHKGMCETCPLRRERIDKNGNKHLLFCYFVIQTLLGVAEETREEFENEEIKYTEALEKELKQINDNK